MFYSLKNVKSKPKNITHKNSTPNAENAAYNTCYGNNGIKQNIRTTER